MFRLVAWPFHGGFAMYCSREQGHTHAETRQPTPWGILFDDAYLELDPDVTSGQDHGIVLQMLIPQAHQHSAQRTAAAHTPPEPVVRAPRTASLLTRRRQQALNSTTAHILLLLGLSLSRALL